jgi:DNA-binding transcriptional regulator LsrR (DeoR family)
MAVVPRFCKDQVGCAHMSARRLESSASPRHLEAIGVVIPVAYGDGKAAVTAAMRGGLVNGLITHTELARVLLGAASGRNGRTADAAAE